jgi:L-asparagine transporter-like permease
MKKLCDFAFFDWIMIIVITLVIIVLMFANDGSFIRKIALLILSAFFIYMFILNNMREKNKDKPNN